MNQTTSDPAKTPTNLVHPLRDTFESLDGSDIFAATLRGRGLYSTTQFVLRLSPRVHELVDALTTGETEGHDPSELNEAYSTYLHETIHWWQHAGSTSGLFLSLCYPAQCLANITHLREVVRLIGPKKSLKEWAENALKGGMSPNEPALIEANIVVNNTVDKEFYKRFTLKPMSAPSLSDDPYFESVGHSYALAYANTLQALIDSCGFEHGSLPNPDDWIAPLDQLRNAKHEGFYHGSPIRRARIGVYEIYEGQARLSQLQFLQSVGGAETCQFYRDNGYFASVYVSAFDEFLRLTELEWPERIDDPLMNIFLLVCDLAINPTRGIPFAIASFEDLLIDLDPGARFTRLSSVIKDNNTLQTAIIERSREEYISVSKALTEACGYDHPLAALEAISEFMISDKGAQQLMKEWETFEFLESNLPLRVFVAHFLSFSRDKLAHPEFFCWPGAYMGGAQILDVHQKSFERHLSLFSDRGDNDGVFPRAFPDRKREAIQKLLNVFFASTLLYDLTRQWILEDGSFRYDFGWLTGRSDNADLVDWAKKAFESTYGVNPDNFDILAGSKP